MKKHKHEFVILDQIVNRNYPVGVVLICIKCGFCKRVDGTNVDKVYRSLQD